MSLPVESEPLFTPPLEEVARVLQSALLENFAEATASVVDCPDLTEEPFRLKAKGLCGSPRLGDVGGVPNLIPVVQRDKLYDIKALAEAVDLPNAFIVGAGAGPHPSVGVNCELMANVVTGEKGSNGSRIARLDSSGKCEVMQLPESATGCALMLNMFACEGRPGRVLRVWAKERTGGTNLVTCLRRGLEGHFGERPVGLGGAFRLVEGRAKCHVMPDFSEEPLASEEDVDRWLRFFEMRAPMVFLSTLVSRDPGLDLRLEHSHGYGDGTDRGGHYHCDTTPEAVEYEGFYSLAEFMYRVDRPKGTGAV